MNTNTPIIGYIFEYELYGDKPNENAIPVYDPEYVEGLLILLEAERNMNKFRL